MIKTTKRNNGLSSLLNGMNIAGSINSRGSLLGNISQSVISEERKPGRCTSFIFPI
jgi:hypothetical protein